MEKEGYKMKKLLFASITLAAAISFLSRGSTEKADDVSFSLGRPLFAAPAVGAAQASDPAKAIVDRYVEAIGGKANIERIQTRIIRATMSLGLGNNASLETLQQRPDLIIERSKASGLGWEVEFSSGYDGAVGWTQAPEEGFRKLEGSRLQQYILNSRLDRNSRLDELYPTRKVLPDRVIDKKNHHVLEMSTTFGTQEIWCFDAESGLLTLTERIEDKGGKKGSVKVTATLEEYREVDGVRLPFRIKVQEGKDKYTVKVKSVTHNAVIEADKFAPPE
jgi:zinc protease